MKFKSAIALSVLLHAGLLSYAYTVEVPDDVDLESHVFHRLAAVQMRTVRANEVSEDGTDDPAKGIPNPTPGTALQPKFEPGSKPPSDPEPEPSEPEPEPQEQTRQAETQPHTKPEPEPKAQEQPRRQAESPSETEPQPKPDEPEVPGPEPKPRVSEAQETIPTTPAQPAKPDGTSGSTSSPNLAPSGDGNVPSYALPSGDGDAIGEPDHQPGLAGAQGVRSGTGQDQKKLNQQYGLVLYREISKSKSYPRFARKASIEGRLLVAITVDRSGKILSVKIRESSGHTILDNNTLKTIKQLDRFPIPPSGVTWQQKTFVLPVSYKLS